MAGITLTDEKDLDMLLDFGLTRNQARIFATITSLEYASVGQIARESKVRREDVYRILPKLEKMGLVERLLGAPVKIRATPVEEALSILIEKEQDTGRKRLENLKAKKEILLKRFKTNKIKPSLGDESRDFVYLSQRDGILSRSLSMIKASEREIDLILSRTKLAHFLHHFSEPLGKALGKGAILRLISGIPEHDQTIPRMLEEHLPKGSSVELKYTDHPSSHFIIADFKQAMIATNTEGGLAENPVLWTDSKSLVSVLQGNFEDLWHNSFSWKTLETYKVSEKAADTVENLKPTNHVIFVYDSTEAKHNVLFNYIKSGLENGEMAAYVSSDTDQDEIRKAMEEFGIDVKSYEKEEALRIFNYDEVYIVDGKFNMNTTMDLWKKLYADSLAKGFKGLRSAGEMSCFFKHKLVRELLEYEEALHKVLEIPIIGICAYDANVLARNKAPINLYTELVRAHGTVLFAGKDKEFRKIEIRKT